MCCKLVSDRDPRLQGVLVACNLKSVSVQETEAQVIVFQLWLHKITMANVTISEAYTLTYTIYRGFTITM